MPPATVADLGLTRKAVHEARQLRDAEAADPGVIHRTLDERLATGDGLAASGGDRALLDLRQASHLRSSRDGDPTAFDSFSDFRNSVAMNGCRVLYRPSADVQHLCCAWLWNCANLRSFAKQRRCLFLLRSTLSQVRQLRGDHRSLALIQMPAVQIERDDVRDQIIAAVVSGAGA
ncbi:hypothetical protein Q8W71_07355 [Methylobacterium sp. NEAU 140]|uniref:hypothetical protein n=1 Tax=Methylobacterium sp. NEAU 140 TaxID=3064945 RepID=UPI002735E66E|nr:hypothetical protein [Methylobacterium sp. NEAU 140]MDP4022434.1 hypothetical protein [Methylobacterium sp. NEAU 140]